MWFLLVFYIGTSTPPTLEMFPMKTREACKETAVSVSKMFSKDPNVGPKHTLKCVKVDVA
jgi:hypothetical protein